MTCHTRVLVLLVALSTVSNMAGGCLNCFNECDENGQCDEYGCLAGYYGTNCSLPCPTSCRDGVLKKPACGRNTSLCLSGCRQGFFGRKCDQHCPSECVNGTCVQMNGNCIGGCKAHRHGVNCTEQCSTTCHNSTCDRNGLCYSCKTGFWGFFCENNCSQNCQNKTCRVSEDGSFECSHGCQEGWKGVRCQEPILQKTRTRRDDSNCYVKEADGKCPCCKWNTGDTCQIDCPHCRARYGNSKCERFCESGYYNGTNGLCDKPCSKHCSLNTNNKRSCDSSDGSCYSCENGYRGTQCNFDCNPHCLNKTCAIHSAYCLNCSNVTYGNHCQKCSDYCLGKYCHRWSGNCKTGCKRGRYGYTCSDKCPTNCYKSNCSLSIHGSVKCTGCKDGFAGFSCEERCPVNCSICRQLNAECLDRVLAVNTSPASRESSPPASPGKPQSVLAVNTSPASRESSPPASPGKPQSDSTIIVLGVLIPAVIVAVAVAVGICYLKKFMCFKPGASSRKNDNESGTRGNAENQQDSKGTSGNTENQEDSKEEQEPLLISQGHQPTAANEKPLSKDVSGPGSAQVPSEAVQTTDGQSSGNIASMDEAEFSLKEMRK